MAWSPLRPHAFALLLAALLVSAWSPVAAGGGRGGVLRAGAPDVVVTILQRMEAQLSREAEQKRANFADQIQQCEQDLAMQNRDLAAAKSEKEELAEELDETKVRAEKERNRLGKLREGGTQGEKRAAEYKSELAAARGQFQKDEERLTDSLTQAEAAERVLGAAGGGAEECRGDFRARGWGLVLSREKDDFGPAL